MHTILTIWFITIQMNDKKSRGCSLPLLLNVQEVVSNMIRFVWIINKVFGLFPVVRNHLVQQLALSLVAKDVLSQVL